MAIIKSIRIETEYTEYEKGSNVSGVTGGAKITGKTTRTLRFDRDTKQWTIEGDKEGKEGLFSNEIDLIKLFNDARLKGSSL